jgi:hypothetical protein
LQLSHTRQLQQTVGRVERPYLAHKRVGQSVIPVSADPTDVVGFLHLAGVNVPDAHKATLAICVETLIELALEGHLRVERRQSTRW